ncbi:hypothetical protein CYLTODRAFT_465356 [Cylindrobasidium torrendii FP15055 ss-10]|uniref:DNA breaking-rejoining enzyme n=1 Tax=Cylindrobasidium torrendii FP15055 ss-10 TaxID=1314674 RepID=A0A0D7B4N6_9AGAR|nr:hypothetical protein CYLTODRAFT_465356 [Cylindrobasidium torrendii FP15055 ss-10]
MSSNQNRSRRKERTTLEETEEGTAGKKRKKELSKERAAKRTCLERFDDFDTQARKADKKHMEVTNSAWALATRKKYGSHLNDFHKFCERKGIPESQRFPVSHATLLEYVADMNGKVGSKAVGDRVTALKNVHAKAAMPWAGDTRQMQLMKKAVANSAPDPTVEKRAPVTQYRMQILERRLNFRKGRDIAISFAAKVGLLAMLRLGEFLPASNKPSRLEERKLPKGRDMKEPFSEHGSRMLNLPTGKTSGERGALVPLCKQQEKCMDGVRIWEVHRIVNEIEEDTPMASYLDEKGRRNLLTKSEFMKACNTLWEEEGLPPLTGHSFRIGGATHYLVSGVETNVVKAMGRWKSDAFKEYWRNLETLAAIHIELLPVREKISRLKH